MKAPKPAGLSGLNETLARRVGRCLERQGLLERDAENSHPFGDVTETGAINQLIDFSIPQRIALGPQGVHAADAANGR